MIYFCLEEKPIKTEYELKPIPFRCLDWMAWYEGFEDEGMLIGYGATEQEAIDDLKGV